MAKMICLKCGKKIDEKENYYSFTEYNNKKIISIDYAHRKCWDNFMHSLDSASGTLATAQNLLEGLSGSLDKMGIIEKKPLEVEIV